MQQELFALEETANKIKNELSVTQESPRFVSYGGGINSTAMLVLLKAENIVPDAILFADTGGEHPRTYAYLSVVDEWLESIGFPKITTVRYENDQYSTLEEDCLFHNALPSKAYGYGKCSAKWKIDPQKRFKKQWMTDKNLTCKYIDYVGIHAGERSRLIGKNGKLKPTSDSISEVQYPLIERNIYQHHCIALIQASGLPLPGKSSCFFCPSMKPTEIMALKTEYPELYKRAIAIEETGLTTAHTIKGLGRRFKWSEVGQLTPLEQAILDSENKSCGCIDE